MLTIASTAPSGWLMGNAYYNCGDYPELIKVGAGKLSIDNNRFFLPLPPFYSNGVLISYIIKAKVD